jgi:hypothetical protein
MNQILSVIVPAYNEGSPITFIPGKLTWYASVYLIIKQIIVVNYCSAGNTEKEVENYAIT